MLKLITHIVFLFCVIHIYAQSITAYPDTVVCSEEPVTLFASVDGVWGTESYVYEVIPYAPEAIGGTDVSMFDDTHDGPFDIGFEFCFFGEVYDEFYIASNGWISFEDPTFDMDINWTPDGPIPDDTYNVPRPAIYGPWEDWHTGLCSDCIHYETTGVAPNRKLIVTWDEVPMYLCTSDEGTFQFVLHETTNIIDNHLIEIPSCVSWGGGYSVEGIEDESGDFAFAAPDRNWDVWETEDESNRWVPNAINWYETATGTLIGTGDSIVVNPLVTTTYTAEVTLCDGTTVSDEVTITIAEPYEVNYTIENILCYGDNDGVIDITITDNINPMIFSWSNSATSEDLTGLTPGIYSVTIEETDGCITTLDFEITEPPLLTLDTLSTQNITCNAGNDGVINLIAEGGVEPYSFSILEDVWQSSENFTDLYAGDYTITIEDNNGCSEIFEVTLTEPEAVIVDAGDDIVIPFGGFSTINAITNASAISLISWTPFLGLSCADCLNPEASPDFTTTYTVIVTNEYGCFDVDEITVIVQYDYAAANVFTPNGDGVNDYFMINAEFIQSLELFIYSRWGETLYSTKEMNRGWDGTFSGISAEVGTYMYVAKTINVDGTETTKTGTLLLLR
ncbi:MAG: gliding motility-associated C-terminal domain-containing protein [Fimbriimonadaceae bacterium]|nr:gliding motility-associated C-terminal domain-containing protein [Chitinophagales bacterium]